jgi:hypothetical protein
VTTVQTVALLLPNTAHIRVREKTKPSSQANCGNPAGVGLRIRRWLLVPAGQAQGALPCRVLQQVPVAQRLLEQPITSTLARLATPNVVSMLASTAIGVAESWYVGRLGTLALAGLALVFPMFMLMNMLAAGAIGGSPT